MGDVSSCVEHLGINLTLLCVCSLYLMGVLFFSSKIFPNIFVFVMSKPFTHNFNGNNFAVAKLGLIASSTKRSRKKLLK